MIFFKLNGLLPFSKRNRSHIKNYKINLLKYQFNIPNYHVIYLSVQERELIFGCYICNSQNVIKFVHLIFIEI